MAVLKLPLVVAPQRKEANGGIKAAGRETEQCILPLRRVAARVASVRRRNDCFCDRLLQRKRSDCECNGGE
jgi:hypothetical protein